MASNSEVGHAKNVANFSDLIAFVTGYGATYNPTKAALKLAALNTQSTAAISELSNVVTKNVAFNNAENARMITFSNLRSLSTRIMSALKATDASAELIRDAQTFNRKLQGKRAKPLPPTDPNTPAPNNNSVSQLSYDMLIQHFTGLIAVLASEPAYAPGENELKVTTLNTKLSDMIAKNNAVSTAYTAVNNARMSRDKALYKPLSGLVDTAIAVKLYIQSLYGATSLEYKQVRGIHFKKF